MVKDCIFGTSVSENGILIAGVSTRGLIKNNYFQNIGSQAFPAIHLSGGGVGTRIEGNQINGNDDAAAGWGITLGASCEQVWVNNNFAGTSSDDVDASAFEDASGASENNSWGRNFNGDVPAMPD